MIKVFLIDNYDSFTYNLVHILRGLGAELTIKRNDQFEISELEAYDKILISPGPGIPDEAGLIKEVIRTYAGKKPILGVCLGHQAIAEVYGGEIYNMDKVYHGVGTKITVDNDYMFKDLPAEIVVGRYHSWSVKDNLPKELEVTAHDENGIVMALKHKKFDVRGVQFHPESILTPRGTELMKNWLEH
jgi:anthranilate synthase component 2